MNRSNLVIAAFGLLLVAGMIWGISVLGRLNDGDCMAGSASASCPALVEVNGVRYFVSVARGVVVTQSDLTPFGPITRTNVPEYFRELASFALAGVSPTAALAAPAAMVLDEDDSHYRIIWGPDQDSAFPAVCRFFRVTEQALREECAAARPSGR